MAKAVRSLAKALEAPASVTALSLRGSATTALPPEIARLVNLETLDLSQTKIKELTSQVGKLSKLVSLSLSECHLCGWLPAELGELANLTQLDVWATKIKKLPDPVFDLPALTALDIGACSELVLAPGGLSRLPRLERLNLYGRAANDIPADVFTMASLRDLKLGNEALDRVPDAIGQLVALRSLDLTGGTFTSLPDSIRGLVELETLDLGRCSKLDLGQTFALLAGLPKLRELGLSGAQPMKQWFAAIPPGIAALRGLRKLTLAGNQLTAIPDDLFDLAALEELDLDQNVIGVLPPAVGNLRKLKKLSLQFNRYNSYIEGSSNIDLGPFFAQAANLVELRELDLGWMSLATLPDEIAGFPALRKLILNYEFPADERPRLAALLPKVSIKY